MDIEDYFKVFDNGDIRYIGPKYSDISFNVVDFIDCIVRKENRIITWVDGVVSLEPPLNIDVHVAHHLKNGSIKQEGCVYTTHTDYF